MDSEPQTASLLPDITAEPLMHVHDLFIWGKAELAFLGEHEAENECERLLEHLLKCSRAELYLKMDEPLTFEKKKLFQDWIFQRRQRMPLGYILGEAYFWDLKLEVGVGCLVPRPETEILVESVIRLTGLSQKASFDFLDFGAGSGAVSIVLLRHFEKARAVLLEISSQAAHFAAENLEKYQLQDRANLVVSNGFEWLEHQRNLKWDLIISNPPYLSHADLKIAEPELFFEPDQALNGGIDGLDYYRRLIQEAAGYLNAGGWLALEMGVNQAEAIADLVRASKHWQEPLIIKDYLGIDRVIMAEKLSSDHL